ncbi:hypothetical protein CEXT_698421 [Caerostris extrusa]|uniref:Maturase K n=1 Tax=Caerostris extrusa TaxID=172846 RepID=A0AAV4VTK3_CAEEX|nr:hypothetical protein CEXT_698421 [Caerostris extrusa]
MRANSIPNNRLAKKVMAQFVSLWWLSFRFGRNNLYRLLEEFEKDKLRNAYDGIQVYHHLDHFKTESKKNAHDCVTKKLLL